jgi:hypothetical protein
MTKTLAAAFDYETYYSKTYSIRDLGNYGYTHHEEFDAFLLSVAGQDGFKWCGNPKDFDWGYLDGKILVAHNAGFEQAVTERLVELGICPGINAAALVDTADLAAYLGYPRSLAAAAEGLLRLKIDKGVRDRAKGLHWNDMTLDFQQEMVRYAQSDSDNELRLWLEHGHRWPAWERRLSQMTRDMCSRGIPVDIKAIADGIKSLQVKLWEARCKIPWASDEEAKVLSPKAMAEECHKNGITPPKSMAKDSEEFDEWLRKHGDDHPFAKAMGDYRSMNILIKKLEAMKIRTKPDGWMNYGLKYGGAHTLRDSGDAGVNVQNYSRKPMYGIDMRGMICAPDGLQFGVVDLSAIEPCALSVLSGDEELAQLLREGMDPYEAQARIDGEYDGTGDFKTDHKDIRQFNKVKVLGCGYGAGPEKVQVIAKTMVGIDLTLDETKALVAKFRSRPYIPGFWRELEEAMAASAPDDFHMTLPSGRVMRYRDVKNYGSISAVIPRLGKMMRLKFWGGTLTENIVQASSRDVFMDRCIVLEDNNLPPLLRVHDEAVCLLKEDTAEDDLKLMTEIMSTNPDWWPELPLRAEGHLCKRYTKE